MDSLALDKYLFGPVLKNSGRVIRIEGPLGISESTGWYLTMTQVFPMAPSPTMTILVPIAFYIDRINN